MSGLPLSDFVFKNRVILQENPIQVRLVYLTRIIYKPKSFIGGEGWSSPSIAGQERETERVSLGMG